jgi:DNA polymerase III alpha subunit
VHTQTFTHLHVHSHFSLLRGTASVDELVARAASEGMAYLALTDSQALYGAVAFGRACHKAGIQPILGMTVTVAPAADSLSPTTRPDLLVLLATGPEGGIERRLRAGDPEAAARFAAQLHGIYPGSAHVSLEIHRPEDQAMARAVEDLGRRHGLLSLPVQPVYCLAPEDRERLRLHRQ